MRLMPKVAFYEHLKLTSHEKKLFVSQIDKITLAHSVKPHTMNIADGEKHHEILVLQIDLKRKEIDGALLASIARQNHHPLLFVCRYLNETCIYVYRHKLYDTGWMESDAFSLNADANDIDQLWDSICSQIALGETTGLGGDDLDERLSLNQRIFTLETEIEKLSSRSRKEKQLAKKNRLYEQVRIKREELRQLKAGVWW
jgi:hypothetical protein